MKDLPAKDFHRKEVAPEKMRVSIGLNKAKARAERLEREVRDVDDVIRSPGFEGGDAGDGVYLKQLYDRKLYQRSCLFTGHDEED